MGPALKSPCPPIALDMSEPIHLHASAVVIDGHGVIISGASGSGKSDMALRLIDRGGALLGDDALYAAQREDVICITPAPQIAGKIEVYGLGILTYPFCAQATARLWVELDRQTIRMPDGSAYREIAGVNIPLLHIDPWYASAPVKVELALREIIAKLDE